jgi:hypothetical protein
VVNQVIDQDYIAPSDAHRATSVRRGMIGLLTGAVLALLPCVNVGGPVVFLTPPVFAATALFAWLTTRGLMRFDWLYSLLALLVVWCFLPWLTSAEYISGKALVHGAAILVAITLYYAVCRVGLIELLRAGRQRFIFKTCYLSLLAVSVFIIAEFLASNLFGLDFHKWIPYIEVPDFEALVLGVLQRPRGLASEPGVMALYYDFMLFFVLPFVGTGWKWRFGYIAIILPAYLLLFSAASLVSCAIALVLLTLMRLKGHFLMTARRVVIWGVLLGAVSVVAIDTIGEAFNDVVGSRLGIFAGGGEDSSAITRSEMYGQIAEVVAKHPFGIGFGTTAGLASVGNTYEGMALAPGQISLFGMFFIAGGIPAGLCALFLTIWAVLRASKVAVYGPYLAAGGLAISLHQLFVTEFWLPFFWFFLAAVMAFFNVQNQPRAAISS